jgi:single-stranded-DNA-specific exonuclease
MHRRWVVNRTNPEYIHYLSKSASISTVLSQILINRGIKSSTEIYSFLNAGLSQLSDPFDMPGMKPAVERILSASKIDEKVFVHGDFDVDGISATAIILHALRMLGIESYHFIPNRMEHGYGFNPPSVEKAKQTGATLIITVDCGITSFEAAALCRKEDIDVIITDHHEPVNNKESEVRSQKSEKRQIHDSPFTNHDFMLPEAVAVINPKIFGSPPAVSNLSGAGVALKLVQALAMSDARCTMHDYLDLAALGTMADVVPLTGENRIIVKEGLRVIENGSRPGVHALKEVSGIGGKAMKTGLLLFTLIPRINAAGRISDANKVLNLMLTHSEEEAICLSSWLDRMNTERQQIEEKVYQEAISMLADGDQDTVIILSSERWHRGVIGIVASRLAEKFYRPAILLSVEEGIARGSARSIPPFDIYTALTGCRQLLRKFGGHKQAAGMELDCGNITLFGEQMKRFAREALAGTDFIPSLKIEADVTFSDISFNLINELGLLEPFGYGNPSPLLGSKGLEMLHPKILKDAHLKMKLRQRNQSFDAIGFDMAAILEKLEGASAVDAVFTPEINEWNGGRCLQLNLKALRPSPKNSDQSIQ